jgi:hypothetical protein
LSDKTIYPSISRSTAFKDWGLFGNMDPRNLQDNELDGYNPIVEAIRDREYPMLKGKITAIQLKWRV